LGYFLIIILLVGLKFLVHPICLGDVLLHNILPCSFDVGGLLFVFCLLGGILDLVPLVQDVSHVPIVDLLLLKVVPDEVRIELKGYHLATIDPLESHVRVNRVQDLLTGN
jgi:hypothetical protein